MKKQFECIPIEDYYLVVTDEYIKDGSLPTTEEFYNQQKGQYTTPISKEVVLVLLQRFAKFHVEAALKAARELQKIKYYAGETGYLKQEDWENVYPLTNIK